MHRPLLIPVSFIVSIAVMQYICHLVENEPVEVWHVALVGHRPFVVVLEVLLQGHRIMRDVHHCTQVMRKHLRNNSKVCGVVN